MKIPCLLTAVLLYSGCACTQAALIAAAAIAPEHHFR
jgi:hypothetical protein